MRRLLFLITTLITKHESAKILAVFPTPSISHQVVFRALTHELARRGHEVVVVTTDPAFPRGKAPENLTEVDLHDMSYREWKKQVSATDNGRKEGFEQQFKGFYDKCFEIFLMQIKTPAVQDIINNQKDTFDLLVVEDWTRFAIAFAHVIKAPVISFSSLGSLLDSFEVMGAPTHPFLYPTAKNTRVHNMTPWEKLQQYHYLYSLMRYYYEKEEYENTELRKIFGDSMPAISELRDNIDLLFINIHPIFEGIRPVPPSIVHVGGLHQNPIKELPQEVKTFMDSSANGVIYVSFGTNVDPSVLPPEKIQNIIKALSGLPYDVLWKWNDDVLPGQTENIKISKWFPQSDLLRHPKIKLFITQGGLQSTDESITAGVPLIGIPMLGDQWFNVEQYVHHKIGMGFELHDLEVEPLRNAIETVIKDKSYRENVVRLRTLMYDQPLSSLERAVWWTEHALRHGGARHLRAPAANMPLADYYDLPLALTVLSVIVAVIVLSSLLVIKMVILVLRHVTNSGKIKKT